MEEIRDLLLKTAKILKENNEIEWDSILTALHVDSHFCQSQFVLTKIMELYGGIGYLNDIVLKRDGKSLVEENAEFYKLRHALYKKCIETGIVDPNFAVIELS